MLTGVRGQDERLDIRFSQKSRVVGVRCIEFGVCPVLPVGGVGSQLVCEVSLRLIERVWMAAAVAGCKEAVGVSGYTGAKAGATGTEVQRRADAKAWKCMR